MKERKEQDWLEEAFAEDVSRGDKKAKFGKKDFDWLDDPFSEQEGNKADTGKQGMTRGSKLLIGGVLCLAFILLLVFVILIGYSILSGNTSSDTMI